SSPRAGRAAGLQSRAPPPATALLSRTPPATALPLSAPPATGLPSRAPASKALPSRGGAPPAPILPSRGRGTAGPRPPVARWGATGHHPSRRAVGHRRPPSRRGRRCPTSCRRAAKVHHPIIVARPNTAYE
ncbi:Os01g0103400, partial [Oryza sativa Japonica Group]